MIHFVKGFFKDMDRGIEFKADGGVNKCIDIAISAYHNKMRGSIILIVSLLVTTLLFGLAFKLKALMGFVHNSIIYDVVAGLSEMRSTGIGWALGVGRIGGMLGPTLGGVLVALELPLSVCFLVFAIPSFISALAILAVQQRYSSLYLSSTHVGEGSTGDFV